MWENNESEDPAFHLPLLSPHSHPSCFILSLHELAPRQPVHLFFLLLTALPQSFSFSLFSSDLFWRFDLFFPFDGFVALNFPKHQRPVRLFFKGV